MSLDKLPQKISHLYIVEPMVRGGAEYEVRPGTQRAEYEVGPGMQWGRERTVAANAVGAGTRWGGEHS